jgi:hypothetical protein
MTRHLRYRTGWCCGQYSDPRIAPARHGWPALVVPVNTGRMLTRVRRPKIDPPLGRVRGSCWFVVGHPPEVAVFESVAVAT